MAAVVGLSLAWLWWSLQRAHLARCRDRTAVLDAEAVVLVSALWLSLVGIGSTLLAIFGAFDGASVAIAAATGALSVQLTVRRASGRPGPRLRFDGRGLLVAGLVVVGGMALRLPPSDYALAGRDQGTYTLQAEHAIRTGGLGLHDPVLADASRAVHARPGPGDVLGLYPVRGDAWARDLYEGAYRPGFYLADRERGRVVPQFLHLHPMLMAAGGLVLGPSRMGWVIALEAALALLAVWTVARRLLAGLSWALLATGLVAVSPLLVWVHRTALTEVLATVLLFSAVLAVLRARDGEDDLELAGLLLGATAWLRGHAWIVAPVMAALLWLVPPGDRAGRRGSIVYLFMVLAGVSAHAVSSYPYLHDELARQLPGELHPSPVQIVIGSVACALVWWGVDERWGARRQRAQGLALVARAPALFAAGLGSGLGAWLLLRGAEATRPFSRLDPLLTVVGIPLAVLAAVGLVRLARVRLELTAAHVWLAAIGASIVVTTGLYAQRNLPQLQLYYYGRYLAPELWIVAALGAAHATEGLTRVLARRRVIAQWGGRIGAIAITGVLAWSVAGVLVIHPVTRLREFAGAEAAVDRLASLLPEGAIVIAGGEGWHHGHTWNQIGGALALRTGVTVLPYRTREAAYATLHELLVTGPAAEGRAAPPVFLLVNEATKPYTRKDSGGEVVAGIDDLLAPPFSATRIDLVELVVDRLTPTAHEIPTRVTRDGLRMGLFAVKVAPEREAEVERHRFRAEGGRPVSDRGAVVHGGRPKKGAACLHPHTRLVVELPTAPPGSPLADGPVSIVLVSTPGSSADTHAWQIEIDDTSIDTELPDAPPRARDTLGPVALPRRPSQIAIRGSARTRKGAVCPHGGLAELRVLGPDRGALSHAPTRADTLAPHRDLGVPVRRARWVSARGLSRYRPGISPSSGPEIRGVSMVLRPGEDLAFSPEWMPAGGEAPIDLIVTLTRSRAGADARLVVLMNGEPVLDVPLPPTLDRSWQSEVVTLPPPGPLARFGLRLVGGPDAEVLVRDIGLFSRAAAAEDTGPLDPL